MRRQIAREQIAIVQDRIPELTSIVLGVGCGLVTIVASAVSRIRNGPGPSPWPTRPDLVHCPTKSNRNHKTHKTQILGLCRVLRWSTMEPWICTEARNQTGGHMAAAGATQTFVKTGHTNVNMYKYTRPMVSFRQSDRQAGNHAAL